MNFRTLSILLAVTFIWTMQTEASVIPGSTMVNQATGNTYHLLSTQTWAVSEAEAISLGGHLVTINDQAEQDWVFGTYATFAGSARTLWIGLHQLPGSSEPGGGWVWASGEPVTYTHWSSVSPDNAPPGGQDYGYMYYQGFGVWDDAPDDHFFLPLVFGVVEVQMSVGVRELSWGAIKQLYVR